MQNDKKNEFMLKSYTISIKKKNNDNFLINILKVIECNFSFFTAIFIFSTAQLSPPISFCIIKNNTSSSNARCLILCNFQ